MSVSSDKFIAREILFLCLGMLCCSSFHGNSFFQSCIDLCVSWHSMRVTLTRKIKGRSPCISEKFILFSSADFNLCGAIDNLHVYAFQLVIDDDVITDTRAERFFLFSFRSLPGFSSGYHPPPAEIWNQTKKK